MASPEFQDAAPQRVARRSQQTLVDTETAARRLGLSTRSLEHLRCAGGGPPFVRIGLRKVRYRVADLDCWIAERTFAHRADELSRRTGLKPGRGGDRG